MAAKFLLKVAKDGQFYFNLKAGNGETILMSEVYQAKAGALNGIASVQKNSSDAGQYDKLVSVNEKPYFVLKAANHEVIGQSEMYESEAARDAGIESVMRDGSTGVIEEAATA